jgi:hypothetical protein
MVNGWYWTNENPCDSKQSEFSHLAWISNSDLKAMPDPKTKEIAEWLKSGNEYYAHD